MKNTKNGEKEKTSPKAHTQKEKNGKCKFDAKIGLKSAIIIEISIWGRDERKVWATSSTKSDSMV